MMGGLTGFLFIYFLGGITFIPLVLICILVHAYFTFPVYEEASDRREGSDVLIQPGDDVDAITSAQKTLGEKFQLRNNGEADVAAGYFAVTREYTPGGINAAPPERSTPIGSTTVSAPSQSVYQSMYKSLFDRKPSPSPLDNKGAGKPQRRGGNVFYVVLRHGHLMLYDDEEQLDVRHVVSLAHHNVSIYGGGEFIPEGELFIKRNALCLSRKIDARELNPDGSATKPFYLFSELCSEKEDFYFALLRNQEREVGSKDNTPMPLQYDVKDIITLVQRLHSSEEHLQTRWINAIVGRVFLALYKTPEVENFVRGKITKKISRVKTPAFLSKIALRQIDMGEAAPVITNPRLKDLTVDGELIVEADVRYSGNFRLEVAATARIDLGARFKAREVELLLAVVVKRLEGHGMVRIKPPPSNRLWVTFSSMPKIDMTIEPIVSSRQITYTLILRQIENRIKEVIAESLVFPNWDDSPFYHTEDKLWRGGIWADEHTPTPQDAETVAAQEGNVDIVSQMEAEHTDASIDLPQIEKSISMPVPENQPSGGLFSRRSVKSFSSDNVNPGTDGTSTASGAEIRPLEKPRAIRSGSLVASSPIVSTDNTTVDALKDFALVEGRAMASIAALSQTNSPVHTPVGSPSRTNITEKRGSQSSTSSKLSANLEKQFENEVPSQSTTPSNHISKDGNDSDPPSPTRGTASGAPSIKSFGSIGRDPRRESTNSSTSSGKLSTAEAKRISLAAVTNAAATAKKWGWNAIQRNTDHKKDSGLDTDVPARPLVMGRGQPLPPPGTPLPHPMKRTPTAPIPVPKRKPLPPPTIPHMEEHDSESSKPHAQKHAVPPPLLPKRRSRETHSADNNDDGLLVVAAPAMDSEPTTPLSENAPAYLPEWADEGDDGKGDAEMGQKPPHLPRRRPVQRVLSTSPEEDGPRLPSWLAAQEEEARGKSTFVDEDMGV